MGGTVDINMLCFHELAEFFEAGGCVSVWSHCGGEMTMESVETG
jgi:hypothetical protein